MNVSLSIASFFLIAIVTLMHTSCTTHQAALEQQTPLPLFISDEDIDQIELIVLFHVLEDGSFDDVRIVNTSGDSIWDQAAADSMKNWTLTNPNPDSSNYWVRRNVVVNLVQSEVMNIGELISDNKEEADLLYARLRAGESFHRLVNQTRETSSIGKDGYFRKEIQTSDYPAYVAMVLHKLNPGEFTQPINVNGEYIIYMRYGDYFPASIQVD